MNLKSTVKNCDFFSSHCTKTCCSLADLSVNMFLQITQDNIPEYLLGDVGIFMGLAIQDALALSAGSDLIDANCCEISSGPCPRSSLKALFPFSLSVPFGRFLSDISALTLKGRQDTWAVRSFSRSGCTSSSGKNILLPSPGEDMLSFSGRNRYWIPSQTTHNVFSRTADIQSPHRENRNNFYIPANLEKRKLWEGLGTFSQWCVPIPWLGEYLRLDDVFRDPCGATPHLTPGEGFIIITDSSKPFCKQLCTLQSFVWDCKHMEIECLELMHVNFVQVWGLLFCA